MLVPLTRFLTSGWSLCGRVPHAWLHLPHVLSCSHLDAQSSTFPLSTCQQEISWPYVYLCSMCLTTSKAMFLAVWPTLAGSQDIAMLCMDHSAMEPPLSCLKALQCTLTQVRKWWEKVWLVMAMWQKRFRNLSSVTCLLRRGKLHCFGTCVYNTQEHL